MAEHCQHVWKYLHRLIYSGVLQSAQFYLFMWLFWRTPSTLKIAKSSPPKDNIQLFILPITEYKPVQKRLQLAEQATHD